LLHDNAPAHKAASVCQFLIKKCYNLLSSPVLSRFISARLFCVPQVENEVKRNPICGCCWDLRRRNWWIKEGPKKRNFRQLFRNLYDCADVCIYASGAYFELKKICVFPMCLRFLKKLVLKLLDRTVYVV
jgi:hypothetical protein